MTAPRRTNITRAAAVRYLFLLSSSLLALVAECNNNQHQFAHSINSRPRGRALIPLHGISGSRRVHEHFTSNWLDDDGEAIDAFLYDASKVQSVLNSTLTTPCHLISRDSSYTKSWTNADWDVHTARPLARYWNHVRSWPSSTTASAVMPIVGVVTLWSSLVCLLAVQFPSLTDSLKKAYLKSGLLGSFASPIALLLTLRTNRAMDRLLDARKAWGLMNRSVRALTGLNCAYVAPTNGPLALLSARYLAVFAWTLKGYLRGESDEDVIRTVLPPDEAEWILSAPSDRPTAILARLRKIGSVVAEGTQQSLPVPTACHLRMCELLYDIEQAVGINKRILGSPIPPTFTRHSSRLLCLYLGLLPLSLLGFGISPGAAIITTILTSYILVGIDEIGLEIEHSLNILPMHCLCTVIQRNVMDQVVLLRDMPKLP